MISKLKVRKPTIFPPDDEIDDIKNTINEIIGAVTKLQKGTGEI